MPQEPKTKRERHLLAPINFEFIFDAADEAQALIRAYDLLRTLYGVPPSIEGVAK